MEKTRYTRVKPLARGYARGFLLWETFPFLPLGRISVMSLAYVSEIDGVRPRSGPCLSSLPPWARGERAHGFIYHYSSGSRLLVWILFTFR